MTAVTTVFLGLVYPVVITGLAQVSNPYDQCLDDVRRKVMFDVEYMRRQSLFEDMRIMLKTVPVMLLRIGGW